MKKIGLILLTGLLVLAPGQLRSQSDDPSELFLKAYMTSQQGEKLEHDNQFKAALAKYRFAGSLLEELRKTHADWQPAIVEYRSRKVAENILRVQDKASTQADLAAGPTPLPGAAPVLPQQSATVEPSLEIVAPQASEAPTESAQAPRSPPVEAPPVQPTPVPPPSDAAIRTATKKLQGKVDQLEAELEKSHKQFSAAAKEKDTLNDRLRKQTRSCKKQKATLRNQKARRRRFAINWPTLRRRLRKFSPSLEVARKRRNLCGPRLRS